MKLRPELALILIFCFSPSVVFARVPSRYEVVIQLQNDGPINWVPYAQSSVEKASLFQILTDIVLNPTGLTPAIRERALVESGKFSYDDQGNLLPGAVDFDQAQLALPIQNSRDEAMKFALIQALVNANVPGVLDDLDIAIQSSNAKIANFALDNLNTLVNPMSIPPNPQTDEYKFDPVLGRPISRRIKSEEWLRGAKAADQMLDKFNLSIANFPFDVDRFKSIRASLKATIALAEAQGQREHAGADSDVSKSIASMSDPVGAPADDQIQVKKSSRRLASIARLEEMIGVNRPRIILLLGATLACAIWLLQRVLRRR